MVTAVSISIYSTVTSLHKLQLLQVLIHCDAKPSFFQNAVWMTFWAFTMDGKKDGMERRGKRRFLEWRWWLCHRQQLFDSSMCPFLPANLNKEKSERPSEEKSWRKISQKVTSNICHLQKPSSESERLWRRSGPKTIYPSFWFSAELMIWNATKLEKERGKKTRMNLLKSFSSEKRTSISEGLLVC